MRRTAIALVSAGLLGASLGSIAFMVADVAPAWRGDVDTINVQKAERKVQPPAKGARTDLPRLFSTGSTITSVQLRVLGIVSAPHPRALIGVDERQPVWLSLGERHDGVQLVGVGTRSVRLDTVGGVQEIALGDTAPPQAVPGQAPQGVRPQSAPEAQLLWQPRASATR